MLWTCFYNILAPVLFGYGISRVMNPAGYGSRSDDRILALWFFSTFITGPVTLNHLYHIVMGGI